MANNLAGWTIIFDLDGTLIDTAPDLLNALNHTLVHANLTPIEMHTIRGLIGHGAKAMIRAGIGAQGKQVTEADMTAHWQRFIEHYTANIALESRPFEGCLDALDVLQDAGATLAVCTNKPQALADQVLAELQMASIFRAVVGADSVDAPKPNAQHVFRTLEQTGGTPERSVFVGDSETDEKAAHNAGLPFFFVPFGYASGNADDIKSHDVIQHYSELYSAVLAVAR